MRTATGILRTEHEAIVRMLDLAGVLAHRLTNGEPVSPQVLNGILEFFTVFNDACHDGKEEGLLFPLLERKGIAVNGGPLGVMLHEHEEGRDLVKRMQKA